jgi:GNAT superfamily N-acetyltransferase
VFYDINTINSLCLTIIKIIKLFMEIRKAVKEDCAAIMQLVRELAIYEKEPHAVTVSMEHFIESGFGEKPVWEAYVIASPNPSEGGGQAKIDSKIEAKEEVKTNLANLSPLESSEFPSPSGRIGGADSSGAIVFGFALYYIRYSTWKGQRMYLEDFYVTESRRGSGAGKLLFDKLIEVCKEKKYSGLVWQVLDWNEPAINFYKKYDGVKFDAEWVNCSMEF